MERRDNKRRCAFPHGLLADKTRLGDFVLQLGRRTEQNLRTDDVLRGNFALFGGTSRLKAHAENPEFFEIHAVAAHQVARQNFEQVEQHRPHVGLIDGTRVGNFFRQLVLADLLAENRSGVLEGFLPIERIRSL